MFLNMNGAPIIANVDQDCAELTAKGKVLNQTRFFGPKSALVLF